MSLRSSSAKLSRATKNIRRSWSSARDHWHDTRSQSFEQQYIAGIESAIRTALAGMDHMEGLITQARKDCQ